MGLVKIASGNCITGACNMVNDGYASRASISSDMAANWPHDESFTSRPTNTAVLNCIKYE